MFNLDSTGLYCLTLSLCSCIKSLSPDSINVALSEGCSPLRFKVIQIFGNLAYKLIDTSYLQILKKKYRSMISFFEI